MILIFLKIYLHIFEKLYECCFLCQSISNVKWCKVLLSVIIPTINEEKNLALTLENILYLGEEVEVVVVDGGSSDETVSVAKEAGATVLQTVPGRAGQLNLGAAHARGEILLFLHADTRLPLGFYHLVCGAMARKNIAAGAFRLALDSKQKKLYWVAWWANMRSRILGLAYGDQGLFIRRSLFNELGGYPDLKVMEDFAFIRKAKMKGKIYMLDAAVISSARRWQHLGVIRTTCINQLMVIGFLLGVPNKFLAKLYSVGKKI